MMQIRKILIMNQEPDDVDSNVHKEYAFQQFSSEDEDNCAPEEVVHSFSQRYAEFHKLKCSEVSCTSILSYSSEKDVAIVFADRNVTILDTKQFQKKITFKPHNKIITDMKFSSSDPNIIYTSSIDGIMKVWDLRTGCSEKEINANTPESNKPLTAFDISANERIVCAGTELVGEDSFLLFFDLRGNKSLGGYWESHSDDITCVCFHPDNPDLLGTSATDNLLNIFDVSQESEDEALRYCLNTEDTLNYFNWSTNYNKSNILAATDVHSLQYWNIEESAPKFTYNRKDITDSLKRSVVYECYNVPLYSTSLHMNPIILAGSGLEHGSGPSSIRTLRVNTSSGALEPVGLFINPDDTNLDSITMGAINFSEEDKFLTVKDDGCICMWHCLKKFSNKNFKSASKFKNKYRIKLF